MDKVERLLCRIGLHQWGTWSSVRIPLIPTNGYKALEEGKEFTIETLMRTCGRGVCDKGQIRTVLHW